MDFNSEVLKSIDKGFEFFTNWMSQISEKGTYIESKMIAFMIFLYDRS